MWPSVRDYSPDTLLGAENMAKAETAQEGSSQRTQGAPYIVVSPVKYNGKRFAPGDVIPIADEAVAKELIEAAVIKAPAAAADKTE